jgi:Raf kinase inhibitor-like YbhB/YbcL family protein
MPHSQSTRPRGAERARRTRELRLTSRAFADGDTIPRRCTADGDDLSPHLSWSAGPPRTASYALLCEDADAPTGPFVHWLAWAIDADRRELSEGVPPVVEVDGIRQGENGLGDVGYGGPSPPPGKPHRYAFHIYALDEAIALRPGAARNDFERAIEGHVLAQGRLIGMYGR